MARESITFTINLEPLENGWCEVHIEEFPEVFTAAPTADEARVAILDALTQYLTTCLEENRRPVVVGESTLVAANHV